MGKSAQSLSQGSKHPNVNQGENPGSRDNHDDVILVSNMMVQPGASQSPTLPDKAAQCVNQTGNKRQRQLDSDHDYDYAVRKMPSQRAVKQFGSHGHLRNRAALAHKKDAAKGAATHWNVIQHRYEKERELESDGRMIYDQYERYSSQGEEDEDEGAES